MRRLPVLSGQDCVKALYKIGFYISRQHGRHINLRRDHPLTKVTVPNHKELDRGTLKSVVSQAGLTMSEFVELL